MQWYNWFVLYIVFPRHSRNIITTYWEEGRDKCLGRFNASWKNLALHCHLFVNFNESWLQSFSILKHVWLHIVRIAGYIDFRLSLYQLVKQDGWFIPIEHFNMLDDIYSESILDLLSRSSSSTSMIVQSILWARFRILKLLCLCPPCFLWEEWHIFYICGINWAPLH